MKSANILGTHRSFSEQLQFAKQQINELDELRINRTLASNNLEYQHVFQLLPLLLHYNHPFLPTYVEYAPEGIWGFELSGFQENYLRVYSSVKDFAKFHVNSPAFDALYVMGSIGSITQTSQSDMDLWLCHSQPFSAVQQKYVEKKLAKIREWANHFGVEVNIYLMNPAQFKAQQYACEVNEEHSGSAQHFFLLDEFYRSAIRLAGKRLLWLHLLKNAGQDYATTIQQAVNNGELSTDEWVDFGDFSSLSTGEYFGASLWQLYKGIDSPYKSTIKILLLESYAQTYPHTELISKQFKRLIHTQHISGYHFDPYLAMLEQVTAYLTKRQELERLECVRYCFYLKANEGAKSANWRMEKLNELVQSWRWSEQQVRILNDRPNWKIKQAMRHQKLLVNQLLESYHHLIHFARKYHIEPSILSHDSDILMRKLYSVFEVLPGKIPLINSQIARNLAEENLTFIEVSGGSAIEKGWYLINHAVKGSYDPNLRYTQHNKSLNKLVAWAYFNGLLTENTQIHLLSKTVKLQTLRQFIQDLRLSFPVNAPEITAEELYHPNEIRNLVFVINLTNDPTKQLEHDWQEISASDLFNLNGSQQHLIGSVDLIYRNMWNEIRTHHFEGASATFNALKVLSNKIYLNTSPIYSVSVLCYSHKLQDELHDFFASLINRCVAIQTGKVVSTQSRLNAKKWGAIFEEGQAGQNPQHFAKAQMPQIIEAFATDGFLQFFFEDNADGSFNVYALDERNSLECYRNCVGNKEEKVKKINRIYAEIAENRESFNFPQFYQIIEEYIVPFQSRAYQSYMQRAQQKANLTQ